MVTKENKKKKRALTLLLVTILVAAFLIPFTTVFAVETVEEVPSDCTLTNSKPSTDKSTMPDSFSVSKCLSTKGQQGSKFLPKGVEKDLQPLGSSEGVANPAAPASVESTMSAQSVLVSAIDLFVKIIATLALIVFIMGAVLTIVSNGNEDLLGKGKTAMIYSVIGLGVAMLSFMIVSATQSLFFNS